MAAPGFYTSGLDTSDIQKKYTKIMADLEESEGKWLKIQEES